ncbi:MAG: thiamine pyrophosphate-dependent dehydrogenase E1 component subunit alpha [Planctomycetia bacterium]|nr:thiamine pyrophosphate-dependent dehydrogenase E1 component subunit alpha [Planctomycetia bacterium]
MSSERLLRLYREMYLIRRTEEVIADLYKEQEMRCPVHLCIGQEASPVGVCQELEPADVAFSTHRSHGHYLAKGGSLLALMGELYGRQTGCSAGNGGSMHLIDRAAGFMGATPILGATMALATGAAFATSMRQETRVTVAFFGDAAIEEGVFYESANFAVLKRLPLVLVCENNGLSTCSPLSVRQPPTRTICDMARGLGMTAVSGDGNDVLAVSQLARQAIDIARGGGGPVLIELPTYRWREHCGPGFDFDLGYRHPDELAAWQERCPMQRLVRHMEKTGVADAAALKRCEAEVQQEIDAAVRFARESPYPDESLLLAHEYMP